MLFPFELNDSKTKTLFDCIGERIPTRMKIQSECTCELHN